MKSHLSHHRRSLKLREHTNPNTIKWSSLIVFLILALNGWCQENIFSKFKEPPFQYSIMPFWAWNGSLTDGEIRCQIDLMLEKGIYGTYMHARSGLENSQTPYFSEGWWKSIESTLKYSKEKNFYACLYDEDKWPSGSAGGRTLTLNPKEFIKKGLEYQREDFVGGELKKIDKSSALKIFAVKFSNKEHSTFDKKIDLTAEIEKTWTVPEGNWALFSFRMIEDPDKQIDYLDSNAVASFLKITHDQYYSRFSKYFGNTIPGVFFDEIYFPIIRKNVLPWTDDFAESFLKHKGYDIMGELPSLVLINENSNTINYDYLAELAGRYDNAWFDQYSEWCDKHKIWMTGHTEEGFHEYTREGDYFKTVGRMQLPGTDNEDFRYSFPRKIDWYKPKQLASVSHIYGKQKAGVEAMGGGGYAITPDEYRYGFAALGVLGINYFIPHMLKFTQRTTWMQMKIGRQAGFTKIHIGNILSHWLIMQEESPS